MAESFGTGVSRTLTAAQRQFLLTVFQKNKPPLDSEMNLQAQIADEAMAQFVRSQTHSGFFLDPTRTAGDFVTAQNWSNYFIFGDQAEDQVSPTIYANVNGWIVPVTGTDVSNGDTRNLVALYPPPASDARIDFVFLEVWQALVAPNPSAVNKPSASTLYRYGNTEFGGANVPDDLTDPTIGIETTKRVQIQYRIRVFGQGAGLGSSVALDVYPDGLSDPNIYGQGGANAPVSGLSFVNMRDELGDNGLWRAGDGNPNNALGTVDGHTYAIPIAAIFRRNTSPFSATQSGGNANQNGGFDRNPSAASLANPRSGYLTYGSLTLTNPISDTATGVIALTGIASSPLADTALDLSSTFLVIDGEIIGPITSVGANTITLPAGSRGRAGTEASAHVAGAGVTLFNPRPDGLWADQIASTDILDLRMGAMIGDWDFNRLLLHNLTQLVQGQLRTSYKQATVGDTQGVNLLEVAYATSGILPNSTIAIDRPDGVRTVWSDAATIQPDTTVMCDCDFSSGLQNLDTGVNWDVGAGFRPQGFFVPSTGPGIANGSTVFLYIGGSDGQSGARRTFVGADNKAVRFLAPNEYWRSDIPTVHTGRQTPITVRWIDEPSLQPLAFGETATRGPGPMYPTSDTNFETPFIVLGGVLNAASNVSSPVLFNNSPGAGEFEVSLPGLNFDTAGQWWDGTDVASLSTAGITNTVLRGQRTLYDMLTRGGSDTTGRSSEVYLVLYGDTANAANNGAFQVIGAGTVGYTDEPASAANRIRVRALTAGWSAFVTPGASLTAQLRSQYTNFEDDPTGVAGGRSSLAIVFTDIEGDTAGSPWDGLLTEPLNGKMVINTTLQYGPGHPATPRVADDVWRFATVGASADYLRQPLSVLDATFPNEAGVPTGQTNYDYSQITTWNKLASLGLTAPAAPSYGGEIVAFSEQDREKELFLDQGSKSIVFRPYRSRTMTIYSYVYAGTSSLIGATTYAGPVPPALTPKDGAGIWNTARAMELPPEYMPRFGRQDIPYNDGSGVTFLPGYSHLFVDSTNTADQVFNVIGGVDNGGTANVLRMYVQTGVTSTLDYGQYGPIGGGGTGDDAYQGRLYSTSSVISSDLGRGMKGIQLPPYLGIARLYGVYELSDFESFGSAYMSDRKTINPGGATNLLRTDRDKQSLFILQNGAEDITGQTGDHTYIVPDNVIDVTKIPSFVDGDVFTDFEYVVEIACFGFSKDWINGNNYVMLRQHNGSGTVPTAPLELDQFEMLLPSPADNTSFYIGYSRNPYQGDPYMTRDGNTRTTSDYVVRTGMIPVADAFKLATSIQQFDADGALIPETPNLRSLQVLAAIDFYSTLGTGKIGGPLFPGTPLDIGRIENNPASATRIPSSVNEPQWRVVPRTFTEGQTGLTAAYATAGVEILTVTGLAGETVTVAIPQANVSVDFEAGVDFAVAGNTTATTTNLVAAINASVVLSPYVSASNTGTTIATLTAKVPGDQGNLFTVAITSPTVYRIRLARTPNRIVNLTKAAFQGGVEGPVNAGNGTSQLTLTGLSERLPLGILVSDYDMMCENPLCDRASAFVTQAPGIQPIQTLLPLAGEATEYTRLLGGPGQWVGLSDGGILTYEAFTDASPTGSKKFRLYRGGGAAMVLSDPEPGGPVDWTSSGLEANLQPVLKGAALVCKAMLVANFKEQAFVSESTTTYGDEIQMVILTYGVYGDGATQEQGVGLSGIISPTGYGEGYAAADRYRCEGRPQYVHRNSVPLNLDAEPAIFPDGATDTETTC